MNGILIINKERNMTSRDVVNELCKKLQTKKIGHTGTLDPMAEGVLVVAIGKALKIVEEITNLNKEYIAEVTLGIETDTLDITGKIIKKDDNINIDKTRLLQTLEKFKGKYDMEVPKFSAIKVNGKRLYEYARNNENVNIPRKQVTINSIELLELKKDKFKFKCSVSKGTYIRSLIKDICNEINVIGTMSSLVRTKQGSFSIKDSIMLKDVTKDIKVINMLEVIDIPKINIDLNLLNKIKNGQKLKNIYNFNKFCFVYNDELLAIYEVDKHNSNLVKPKKVFINN